MSTAQVEDSQEQSSSPMHKHKEAELSPVNASGKSKPPPFSGGLQVVQDEGFNSTSLRSIFAGNATKTIESIKGEPRRPEGLQGPSTGPGILLNSIRVSLGLCL